MKLALKIALWWAPVLYLKGVGGTSRSLAGGVGFSQPRNQRNIRRTCWWISRKACSDTECGKNNSIGDPRTPSTPSVHWWNSGTSWKKSSKKTTFCKRPAGGGFVIFLWGESESVLVVGNFDDTSFFVVVLVKDLEANWRILDLFHDVLMNYIVKFPCQRAYFMWVHPSIPYSRVASSDVEDGCNMFECLQARDVKKSEPKKVRTRKMRVKENYLSLTTIGLGV